MRIQKLENLGNAINFIKSQGVKLVNVGPDGKACFLKDSRARTHECELVVLIIFAYTIHADIEEGNIKIILGLLWSVILRFQISTGEKDGATHLLPLGFVGVSFSY